MHRCKRILWIVMGFMVWMAAPVHAVTVVTRSADVRVDCGTNGTDVPTDWYFPQPNPNLGLVWVQHGFSRANNHFADISTRIAEMGYIVFATSMAPGNIGCAINNPGFLTDFSGLFPALANPNQGLLKSAKTAATAAGISLANLPSTYVFAGHSAGGPAISHVARKLSENHPAAFANLRGLAFLDPVESMSDSLMASSMPFLTTLPVQTVSSPPYTCNSNASGTDLLANLPRPFVGVRLNSGSHCDAEGSSTDFLCTAFCGTPQSENVGILQTLTKNWIQDYFSGSRQLTYYPGGTYYQSKVSTGRITTLPEGPCGNGAVGAAEQCDDGNRNDGDCCSGFCQFEANASPCTSDDNPCTTDTCNASGSCQHTHNSDACDDGAYCTVGDECHGGVCRGVVRDCSSLADACNQGACNEIAGRCEAQPLDDGSSCDDGDACTASDACLSGACIGSHPVTCTALDDCHVVGVCNPVTGLCSHPQAANGTPCSDGNGCTVDDRCSAGTCIADPHCGDATMQPSCGESCDDGADNGSNACCSAVCEVVDGDGDGVCDRDDPCTSPAVIRGAKISLRGIRTTLPDDKLDISGEMVLPYPFLPTLDPAISGVRMVLGHTTGTALDLTLPAGDFSVLTRKGWKTNRGRTKWVYSDKNRLPERGIHSVTIRDASSKLPGLVTFKIKGKVGPYPVPPGSLPLRAMLILDPPAARTGLCGEASFPGPPPTPSCEIDGSGNTAKCR